MFLVMNVTERRRATYEQIRASVLRIPDEEEIRAN